MRLYKQLLTNNDCFRKGQYITLKGGMLHTTGSNNPNLRRYVGPDDGMLGYNQNLNHWNMPGVGACVHAFIGRLKDGSVATYQTMPWTMRGWHCGRSGNDTHFSVEICEDGLEDASYFAAVYQEAVELFAMLFREYALEPLAPGVLVDHAEGHALGIASNHGDVRHWFSRHGKTMDDFRADVARVMEEESMTEERVREIIRDEVQKIEAERADLSASPWAAELLAEAMARGITDGSRPQSNATRQEVAVMVLAATK